MTNRQTFLRKIPSVEKVLSAPATGSLLALYSRPYVTEKIREGLAVLRREIHSGDTSGVCLTVESVLARVQALIGADDRRRLTPVVNATGTALHTNLGRALLARDAIEEAAAAAGRPGTLEYDLEAGGRGGRGRAPP